MLEENLLIERLNNCNNITELRDILVECDDFLLKYCMEGSETGKALSEKIVEVLRRPIRLEHMSEARELGELLIKDKFDKDELITPSLIVYDFAFARESLGDSSSEYRFLTFINFLGFGGTQRDERTISINYLNFLKLSQKSNYSVNDTNRHILFVIRHELGHVEQNLIDPNTTSLEEQLILSDVMFIEKNPDMNYGLIHDKIMSEFYADCLGESRAIIDCRNKYKLNDRQIRPLINRSRERIRNAYKVSSSPRRTFKDPILSLAYRSKEEVTKALEMRERAIRDDIYGNGTGEINLNGNRISITEEEEEIIRTGGHLVDLYEQYTENGKTYYLLKRLVEYFNREREILSQMGQRRTSINSIALGLPMSPIRLERELRKLHSGKNGITHAD